MSPCQEREAAMDDMGSHAEQEFVSKHPLRPTWWSMLRRCESETDDSYPRYGGRGIKVCERWHDFENFVADMGPRPEGTSLDRIDGDGDYEPTNCRWASSNLQNRNRADNKFIEFKGERLIQKDWALRTGISECTIGRRLAQGWSVEDALTVPPIKGFQTRVQTAEDFAERAQQPNLVDTLYQLPTEQLVAEGNALSARMLSSVHTSRDFAVVVALTQRLQRASIDHARSLNREPLEGMLLIDIEPTDQAPVLLFTEFESRRAA